MAELVQSTYANSLFEVALSHSVQTQVCDELIFLKTVLTENFEYTKMLATPVISREIKNKILEDTFSNRVSSYTFNFLKVLVDNKRFGMILEIIDEYQRIYNNYCGIMEVTAITATELDDELASKLTNRLNELTGKKVKLSLVVDKAVIGGIKLKYDNNEIDATIKSRLDELRQNIKQTTI